jgi:hypothetical protein
MLFDAAEHPLALPFEIAHLRFQASQRVGDRLGAGKVGRMLGWPDASAKRPSDQTDGNGEGNHDGEEKTFEGHNGFPSVWHNAKLGESAANLAPIVHFFRCYAWKVPCATGTAIFFGTTE